MSVLVTIRKKRWWLRFTRFRWTKAGRAKHRRTLGECDPPDVPKKEIRIDSRLRGERLLEVTTHEILHACFWDLDEEVIKEAALSVSRILWRMNYRRNGEP